MWNSLEMSMLAYFFSEIPNMLEFIKTKLAKAAFCVEVICYKVRGINKYSQQCLCIFIS